MMKKRLKGFTLIELIIVMAIFSVVMFSAFQLMPSVGKQFTNTVNYEGARAVLDNVKRYLDGTIRYADRVYVCRDDASNMDANVQTFYDDFYKDVQNLDVSNIYVLEFDNADYSHGNYDSKLTLHTYPVNSGSIGTKTSTSAINEALFDEYSFKFYLGSYDYEYDATSDSMKLSLKSDSAEPTVSEFCVTCDLFKKTTTEPVAIEQCISMPVGFVNINNSTNTKLIKPKLSSLDGHPETDSNGNPMYDYENIDATNTFKLIDTVSTPTIDDSFYVIYTVPDKI